MKGYKLFMDVSGDVMPDIAKGEVQLLPMEFEIGNDEYVYTDGNDGMDPVEFYKFVYLLSVSLHMVPHKKSLISSIRLLYVFSF